MSKQTITIDIDVRDGYELKYNPETRTIEEVKKESVRSKRSKSWDEFCKNHPYITKEYYINDNGSVHLIKECNRKCCNNLETKEDAEGILALIQLTRLHDEWVGDWKGSKLVNNGYIIKYALKDDSYRVQFANAYWQTILNFPTEEMAEEFLKCFKDLIKKAKRFI